MAYSELIKSFHRIRPYMRSFYVYGFKHRSEQNLKSTRSYDNERRRIESWLGEYLRFEQDEEGKRVFLSVDTRTITQNPLYQAFKAKSFTDQDIMLHFLLMDILDIDYGLTLVEILDSLQDYLEEFTEIELPEESSVRKKLKEYEELGLVRKVKHGKQVQYYLSKDEVHLDTWMDAISYFSEIEPVGVIGSYIQSMKEDYNTNYFRFKHHYILDAFDSEILYSLFIAMSEEMTVILNKEKVSIEIIPLKIYISTQTGRQYILGKSLQEFKFYRLDTINSVKIGSKAEITEQLKEELTDFQHKVWGTAIKRPDLTEHLEFVIHIEENESFVVQRLLREKRNGTVTDLGEGNWQFSIDVFDVIEILPWVRTFIGRITSLETNNEEFKKRYYEGLQSLSQMYGGK